MGNEKGTTRIKQPPAIAALSVRLVDNNEITTQEVDLVMAALEEIIAEVQWLEGSSRNQCNASGDTPC